MNFIWFFEYPKKQCFPHSMEYIQICDVKSSLIRGKSVQNGIKDTLDMRASGKKTTLFQQKPNKTLASCGGIFYCSTYSNVIYPIIFYLFLFYFIGSLLRVEPDGRWKPVAYQGGGPAGHGPPLLPRVILIFLGNNEKNLIMKKLYNI